MVLQHCRQSAPTRNVHSYSRRGRETSQSRRMEAVGYDQRWGRRRIRPWLAGRRHQVKDGTWLTATEQFHHDVERVLALLFGRLEQTGQHGLGVGAVLGPVPPQFLRAPIRARIARSAALLVASKPGQ